MDYQPVGIGSDFLGYRIEELVGRGGMGVVYRAYDLRLKRPVALKLVAPALARDERFRARFAREVEVVMSLEHPNVVPIYDAGEVDGRVYLAMRLVDGTDLRSLLRAEGALEPARAVAICSQAAAALDAAHARGLVHRDVKPSNILVDRSGHVYLADFGLTRRLDHRGTPDEDTALGTPAYLAPEQLENRPVDGRADVYSLGCVLYECVTGETVFPRPSRLAVAWAHLNEEPPRPSRRRPGLWEAVDGVVARALAKEPEQRFASCGELVAAAASTFGLATTSPSRRRSFLLATVVGVALAAAAVVVATTHGHNAPATAAAPLYAGPDSLARVDPATNRVSAVIAVGKDPVVTAAADYTVWVYGKESGTITQVNAVTNRRVERTRVSPPSECCSLFTGPVLAADASGAWFVDGRARLVHVPVGRFGKQEYPLPLTPTGVAVGGGAIWVVGHSRHEDAVLRVAPRTGRVTAAAHLPRSARLDSIAYGYGDVWSLSSATATLYRISPRALRVTSRLDVADSRATRPEIMPRGGDIFVSVTGGGGTTYWITPHPLRVENTEVNGPPDREENRGELGSLWWYDSRSGSLYRQQVVNGPVRTIRVTRRSPQAGGPCLTSMAVASGSIWVSVAPLTDGRTCVR